MGWNCLTISKLQCLHSWSLGMDKQFHLTHYNGCNYLSILGLKLIHVSKWGHWTGLCLVFNYMVFSHSVFFNILYIYIMCICALYWYCLWPSYDSIISVVYSNTIIILLKPHFKISISEEFFLSLPWPGCPPVGTLCWFPWRWFPTEDV